MSDYQHCPEGLALYLGAEYFGDQVISNPMTDEVITESDAGNVYASLIMNCKWYRNLTLCLRHLSSMTEEERREISDACWIPEFPNPQTAAMLTSLKTSSKYCDILRSKGFDVGGWCMKEGKNVWVDSYISVGLAKEVKQ